MAAKSDSQITTRKLSEKELTCSVCLEQFKDPKVLPCCHTFCKQCLQPLVKRRDSTNSQPANTTCTQAPAGYRYHYSGDFDGLYQESQEREGIGRVYYSVSTSVSTFEELAHVISVAQRSGVLVPAPTPTSSDVLSCPKCRAEHKVPDGGVDGFLTNFSLAHDLEVAALLKEKEKKPSCGHCESSDPSVAYCVQCEAFLCEFCSTAHKRIKSYREHNVFPFDKITSDILKPTAKPMRCSKHPGEDIKLYCKTCQQLICRDCTLVEHRSHDFHFANDVRQGFKTELLKLVRESKKKGIVYEKELQEIKNAEKFLQSEPDKVKKQITAAFGAYILALQSRREELLAEVDGEYQADSKKIWAHKEFTETAMADITASLRFAGRAHKCSNDTEMISLTKQAIQRLESLNKREHKINETRKVVQDTASYSCSNLEKQLHTCDSIARPHSCSSASRQSGRRYYS